MIKRKYAAKRLALLCMTALIVTATAGWAYASEPDEDMDTEGDVSEAEYESYELTAEDIEEAERSISAGSAADGMSDTEYKSIRDPKLTVSYDPGTGYYVYTMPNGGYFMMNVPIGAITDEAVEIRAGAEAWIDDIFEDGVSVLSDTVRYDSMDELLGAVSEDQVIEAVADSTGGYDFLIKSGSVDRTGITVCSSYGAFRIVRSDIPVWINRVQAPLGYEIGSVDKAAGEVKISGSSVELISDGSYEITFRPVIAGLPEWTSRFVKDTDAPMLTFTPALTGQTMTRPVSFIPSEAGAAVRVYLNNKEVTLDNMTAYADGDYRVTVSDALGNENMYFFSVDTEESQPYIVYLYLVLFLVALSAAVIVTSHGRMRII